MKIDCHVPDGTSGDWRVETFTVTEDDVRFHNLRAAIHGDSRFMRPGTYKRLMRGGTVVMSNTSSELHDHVEPVRLARGEVLINGLGLGVVLQGVIDKPEVTHVTVIEKSPDVIKLVAPTFFCGTLPQPMMPEKNKLESPIVYERDDKRLTVILADAYTWKPPRGVRYNVVWHDIWDNICADNLDGMAKLHRKYGRRCNWQGSWCKWECGYGRFGRYRR